MAAQSWAACGGHQKARARRCPSLEAGRAPGTPRQETFPTEARTSHATWLGIGKRWRCAGQGPGQKAALQSGGAGDGEVSGQASMGKVSFEVSLAAKMGIPHTVSFPLLSKPRPGVFGEDWNKPINHLWPWLLLGKTKLKCQLLYSHELSAGSLF